jgi:hypothetical protein
VRGRPFRSTNGCPRRDICGPLCVHRRILKYKIYNNQITTPDDRYKKNKNKIVILIFIYNKMGLAQRDWDIVKLVLEIPEMPQNIGAVREIRDVTSSKLRPWAASRVNKKI